MVDDADEGGLAGAVGAEKAEDCAAPHMEARPVEGAVGAEGLCYVVDVEHASVMLGLFFSG